MVEYRAVKLSYTDAAPSAKTGMVRSRQGVDLSVLDEYLEDGWRVHTFSFDNSGRWQEAILVRDDRTRPFVTARPMEQEIDVEHEMESSLTVEPELDPEFEPRRDPGFDAKEDDR